MTITFIYQSDHNQQTLPWCNYKRNKNQLSVLAMQSVQTLVQLAPSGPKDLMGTLEHIEDTITSTKKAVPVPSDMKSYLKTLPSRHLEPLWSNMDVMVPPTPAPTAKPYMWKYRDTLPYLSTAGKIVPEEMAERRVLMLVNPSMSKSEHQVLSSFHTRLTPLAATLTNASFDAAAPHTTDSIYAGLQLVNPGEVAPAHRHIAFACRFIISGVGFTAVEGKKMPLIRGDVVVTPSWHWHDHGNESNEPVIWLDVLNLPLFTFAKVHFAEGYKESRYPST